MKVKHPLTYSATLTNRLAYGMVVAILCFVFQLYPSLGKSQTLYWAESITNSIKKASIASPPVTDASATALATPSVPLYMFEDNRNGYVYWSDAGSGSIKKVSTAGGAVTTVLTGITGAGVYPRGIYVDVTNNVLYWAETAPGVTDVIKKTSISGSLPVAASSGTTIASAIDIVRGITVDTLAGNIYFADAGVSGSGQGIYRVSTSGSTTEAASVKVASLSSSEPNSLFIDNANNFIYWSDFLATGGIKRAGISGSLPATPVTVYSGASVRGISIDPGTNTIFWTQYPSLTIQKASLATIPIVSSTSVVTSLAGFPRSVAIPSTFTIAAPSSLSYTGSPYVYTKGTAITPLTPTVTGTVSTWGISPALPTGLLFNTTTGVISGTPTALSTQTTYTITATNSGGNTQTTIQVTVKDIAPSSLSYTGSPFVYTKNSAITPVSPSSTGGTVVSYGISPALPTGLLFNTTTGSISGTPTALSSQTTYTVTATNSGGFTTANIQVTVNDVAPSALSYAGSPFVYTKNTAITPVSPSVSGGAVISYGITPALPTGLLFNTSTGVISGTPTAVSPANSYTVNATNSGGTTNTSVNIKVDGIASFTPTSAIPGTIDTIKGDGFTGATAVSFGGRPATSFTVVSDSVITAVVAKGNTGIVQVTAPAGIFSMAGFTFCAIYVTPYVKILTTTYPVICQGTNVVLTAYPAYGGNAPAYQWYKNNSPVGNNSVTYTDNSLQTGDAIMVTMTSNVACATMPTATSNIAKFTVNPVITPSVTLVNLGSDTICKGQKVLLIARKANVGTGNGVPYQWFKNGISFGPVTTNPLYTDSLLQNGDQIKVILTTPAACVTTNTAESNTIAITVNQPMLTAPVIAGPTNVTPGQAGVVFTTAANPGVQYTWAVSSGAAITMGQNTDTLTVNWGNTSGQVRLKETNACGSSPIATAKVTVTPGVIAQFGKYVPGSEKINMVLYPNPVQNETQLDLKGFTGNVVVTVANMAGKVVWQREKLTNATYTLTLGNLPSGLYVVTAKDGSKTKSLTIVKAK